MKFSKKQEDTYVSYNSEEIVEFGEIIRKKIPNITSTELLKHPYDEEDVYSLVECDDGPREPNSVANELLGECKTALEDSWQEIKTGVNSSGYFVIIGVLEFYGNRPLDPMVDAVNDTLSDYKNLTFFMKD